MERAKKRLGCSQEDDRVAATKASSNSTETFSDQSDLPEKGNSGSRDAQTKVLHCDDEPLEGKFSQTNGMSGLRDGEGSEYSSMKTEVDSGIPRRKCRAYSGKNEGKANTVRQPKTESSSSNSANIVIPASSNDSYQESAVEAVTVTRGHTNTNSSSMSSTCTDVGYGFNEIKVPSKDSGLITERKPLRGKKTDAPKFSPSRKRSLECAKEETSTEINLKEISGLNGGYGNMEEREQSTVSGIDLNEDTTRTHEVEQETAAFMVMPVGKPVAVFARCEVPVCNSAPELGFKGLGKSGWKGLASTSSAFRPTSHFKGADCSEQKIVCGIDLNVDVVGIENEIPHQNDASKEASPFQEKFGIDLNVSSENSENFPSSRPVRDFDLNIDLTASDSSVQEVKEPSYGHGAKFDYGTHSLRNAGGLEPQYAGPMFLPPLTSMPFVIRVPEQADNAGRAFPFHPSAYADPQHQAFSVASSTSVPFYPAHLNGIPAFHGGPGLVEVPNGPHPHNATRIGPLYNPYGGMNLPENASLGGTGMQVLSHPLHPMMRQQLNDFRLAGLPSLTPLKRREPEMRWDSR